MDDGLATLLTPAAAGVRRLKVLLLVTGLEDYTIAFANGVVEHADVVLAVPRAQYATLTHYLDPRVNLQLIDWPRHRSVAGNLRLVATLARLVRRTRPDVVHLLSNNTVWLNLAAPFWRPTPLLTTVHDVETHPGDRETRMLPEWPKRLMVRQSDRVVVHGEALRAAAAERFGKGSDRIHVLSHPTITRYRELAEIERLRPRPPGGRFRVLMFGRVFAYKGLAHLLEAEALLGDRIPGLEIVIAGRGDDPWSLRDLMGDPGRYRVHNAYIPDPEVAQMFLDTDVVVLPYIEASQSGVLNVAVSFGKPVIVTDVGELRSTVEPNRLGLVVPPADPAALAEAIARLAERPELRAELGRSARRWAEGPNAPATVGRHAVDLYSRMVRP